MRTPLNQAPGGPQRSLAFVRHLLAVFSYFNGVTTNASKLPGGPVISRRSTPRATNRLSRHRTLRLLGAVGLLAGCALIIGFESQYRSFEATIVYWWMNGFIPGGTRPSTSYILMHLPQVGHVDPPELIALHITVECASYVVMIPLLLLSAFFLGATRVPWSRWLIGTVAGCAGLLAVNQLRLGIIVFSTSTWGMNPGYDISHVLVGSLVGLGGFIACFFLTLKIMNTKRTTPPQPEPTPNA